MPPDKLALVAEINQKFGVPYTELAALLDFPHLRQAMHAAGYQAATHGSDFRRVLSDEQIAAIQEVFAYGVPAYLIADAVGASKPTITYHTRGMRERRLSAEQSQALKRAKDLGCSLGDLAVIANIHPTAITAALKRSEKDSE